MKKLIIAAVCATFLAVPVAFSQDKPAKSASGTSAVKGEKMKGKHGKHHMMAKKAEVKKTEKKSDQ